MGESSSRKQLPDRSGDRPADEAAIRAVLHRYAFALDVLDYAALASCYAETATAVIQGESLSGVEQIVDYVRARMPKFKRTMHAVSTTSVDLGGDTASTECYAVAYMLEDTVEGDRLLMRGIRYLDEFARIGDMWRITRRLHQPQWMSVLPATEPGTLGS